MIKSKSLSIYVHIPFCAKKCLYCDFLSGTATLEEKAEYVKQLKEEIRKESSSYQNYEIQTVFFGGGTPSILSWREIEDILDTLRVHYHFGKHMEISLEANPKTVDAEKLKAYYQMGINRLSFGLQSVKEEELKTLGRIHTYEDFLQNYEQARKTGFSNINIDLMSALPGQTIKSYAESLQKVCSLNPEHISAYSLIIEEGTPFYDRYFGKEEYLPSEDEEREMYRLTKAVLAKHGYERYEVSNYAKRGYECRHNNVYWQRGNYVGFGSGAASMVENVRWSNCGEVRHALSKQEQMEEFMFLGLRRMEGISKERFYQEFKEKIENVYGEVLKKLEAEGLLEKKDAFLFLTERGIDVSNYVLAQFLLD